MIKSDLLEINCEAVAQPCLPLGMPYGPQYFLITVKHSCPFSMKRETFVLNFFLQFFVNKH